MVSGGIITECPGGLPWNNFVRIQIHTFHHLLFIYDIRRSSGTDYGICQGLFPVLCRLDVCLFLLVRRTCRCGKLFSGAGVFFHMRCFACCSAGVFSERKYALIFFKNFRIFNTSRLRIESCPAMRFAFCFSLLSFLWVSIDSLITSAVIEALGLIEVYLLTTTVVLKAIGKLKRTRLQYVQFLSA